MYHNMIKCVLLTLLSASLLQGCSSDSASYDISDRYHSITLIRNKPYFWSQSYQQSVVIANMPQCQRRYNLADAPLNPYQVDVYDYSDAAHLWVVDGKQYYLLDHIDCKFKLLTDPVPLPEERGALLGRFFNNEDGGLMFDNLVTGQISPGSEDLSM